MTNHYYIVGKGYVRLTEVDWDYLIIVDAGRYDFFKKCYASYLHGKLYRAFSPATSTMEWLIKVFGDYYNVTYISANPYISSKGITTDPRGLKYNAKEHFEEIINVWDKGWNEKLKTVHPSMVNLYVRISLLRSRGKRMIIHYLQPHHPFIGGHYVKYLYALKSYLKKKKEKHKESSSKFFHYFKGIQILREKLGSLIVNYFGINTYWIIRRLLYGDYNYQPSLIYFKEGWQGLRNAYEENYKLVLKYIGCLISYLKGKILITADHGEYLGEYGMFGHGDLPRYKPIIEVPWLEIEKT